MRKKLLYAFSSICLMGAIILGVFALLNDGAQAAQQPLTVSLDESVRQEETSLPSPMIIYQAGGYPEPSTGSSHPAQVTNPNTLTGVEAEKAVETDEAVLTTVEQLSKRYAESVLVHAPGWISIKAERYLPDSNVPLANGEFLPDQYIEETWFNVNSSGQIVESLNRSLLADGNLLRQNYVNDTQEAAGETTEQALNAVTLDYGALLRVYHAVEYGSEVRGWVETEDGVEKYYIVTLTDYYDSPVQFAGQSVKTNSLQAKLVFDMGSGQILNMDIVHQYASGESVVVGSVTILDIQLIPPKSLPEEIQQAMPQK